MWSVDYYICITDQFKLKIKNYKIHKMFCIKEISSDKNQDIYSLLATINCIGLLEFCCFSYSKTYIMF